MNERIRSPRVRLIGAGGEQLGVVEIEEARRRAEEADLDLVEVAPGASPPVCRLMDYGKHLYREKKKQQKSRRKQKSVQVKEVKFRPMIGRHDYETKLKKVREIFSEGDKVKLTVQFRGREMGRPDLGHAILERVRNDLGEEAVVESAAERMGNRLSQVVAPSRKRTRSVSSSRTPDEGEGAATESRES